MFAKIKIIETRFKNYLLSGFFYLYTGLSQGFTRPHKPVVIDDKTLVVLDKAGVVPARQMVELMKKIESSGSRLVMLGDTKQMTAIEAGKPFAQLQEAGMKTERIHEIQRQTNLELKESVEYAANSKIKPSLEKISVINDIENEHERHKAIVADYMKLSPQERQESLILVATNKAKNISIQKLERPWILKGKDTLLIPWKELI